MITITHEKIVEGFHSLTIENVLTDGVLSDITDSRANDLTGEIEIFVNKAVRECVYDDFSVKLENNDNDTGVFVVLVDLTDYVLLKEYFSFN